MFLIILLQVPGASVGVSGHHDQGLVGLDSSAGKAGYHDTR